MLVCVRIMSAYVIMCLSVCCVTFRYDGALTVLERAGEHAGRPAGVAALGVVLPGRHLRGQGAALQDDPAEGVGVSTAQTGPAASAGQAGTSGVALDRPTGHDGMTAWTENQRGLRLTGTEWNNHATDTCQAPLTVALYIY